MDTKKKGTVKRIRRGKDKEECRTKPVRRGPRARAHLRARSPQSPFTNNGNLNFLASPLSLAFSSA